ncbi:MULTISPECIES: M14 family zinc carboxypeptidase [Olivibacter]|uniref:M14 family zinc carboxypeptidase n=1 Tax=Olivibacter jilunii TaxID=985016 RepID=A0ABW6AWU6_9SPHI|nr:M14 family zinc carboxypeptidase [Olivibacter sp. 47]MCL4641159.1 peptidase M14 [Olivibacter sp. UJ_SKK_5.1]MDM8175623.1 M14 family zinc carboxypeptidase [Olivibacter sp. 47]MDX3914232.1 M14 family zinc carboxypeptidase [Pseudosphingobacterium sp.]
MKLIKIVFFALLTISACQREKSSFNNKKNYSPDTAMLATAFETFKEKDLTHRRFKHADIEPLILKRGESKLFEISKLGQSVQKRTLYQLKYGSGNKRVMLWSQMHGNESTATMALFDLFNFLEGRNDQFDSVRNLLNKETTLYFLPMINPDGAQIFNRRNALDIDLNRDARETASPEARILKHAAEVNKPAFGFNLHDQHIYYNVPGTPNPATISFLAPAYNHEKDINDVRGRAMQLIVGMNKILQQYIPNGVAKYDDTHEPRGFGDNFQKWGASTVLIESGGYKNDPEKQYIRKLNFLIILNALIEIAQESYTQYEQKAYQDIPENATKLCDLLIRNIQAERDSVTYPIDLAIKRDELNAPDSAFYIRGRIDDVGDLKDSYGYEELDAKGLSFMKGKLYPTAINHLNELTKEKVIGLLRAGYIAVQVKNVANNKHYKWPLLLTGNGTIYGNSPTLGSQANFFLAKEDEPKYAIVNGYLVDLSKELDENFKNYIQ